MSSYASISPDSVVSSPYCIHAESQAPTCTTIELMEAWPVHSSWVTRPLATLWKLAAG
jgi:hypothetical protein